MGVRTTVAEKIIIDAATPIARGATKFRCSSAALAASREEIIVDVTYIVKENKIEMLTSDIETELSGLMFDVSEAKGGEPFDTLSDALTYADGVLLDNQKKGGMTIKYVQSSNNTYVQYRLMKSIFSVNGQFKEC